MNYKVIYIPIYLLIEIHNYQRLNLILFCLSKMIKISFGIDIVNSLNSYINCSNNIVEHNRLTSIFL